MKRAPKIPLRRSKSSLTSLSSLSELSQGSASPLAASRSNLRSSRSHNGSSLSSLQLHTKRNLSFTRATPVLQRQASSISIDSATAGVDDSDANRDSIGGSLTVLHWLVVGVVVAQFRNLLPLLVVLGSVSLQKSRQARNLPKPASATSFTELSHTSSLMELLSNEPERREALLVEDSSCSTTTPSEDVHEDEWGHFAELDEPVRAYEQVMTRSMAPQCRRRSTLSTLRECDNEE